MTNEKAYDRDPAKTATRLLGKGFCERNFSYARPRKDLFVFHLPGPQSMEYRQVYGPMGVPPEHVEGVEWDVRCAQEALRNTPGMRLKPGISLDERLKDPISQNIISIDFTQNYSRNTYSWIGKLSQSIQSDTFAIHIALQAQRENKTAKVLLLDQLLRSSHQIDYERWLAKDKRAGAEEISNAITDLDEAGRVALARDLGASLNIFNAITGAPVTMFKRIAHKVFGKEYQLGVRRAILNTNLEDQKVMRERGVLDMDDPLDDDVTLMALQATSLVPTMDQHLAEAIYPQISLEWFVGEHQFSANTVVTAARETAHLITLALMYREIGHVRDIKDVLRYKYISESGTPMQGDWFFVRTNRKLMQANEEFLDQFEMHNNYRIRSQNGYVRTFRKVSYLGKEQHFGGGYAPFLTPRLDCGSSAKPRLSMDKARELLESGATIAEIATQYGRVNRRSLAAIKANITRGQSQYSSPEGSACSSHGSTITREEAVEYLGIGFTPKDIHREFPGTSLPTLNAWDYWRKNGKYKERSA